MDLKENFYYNMSGNTPPSKKIYSSTIDYCNVPMGTYIINYSKSRENLNSNFAQEQILYDSFNNNNINDDDETQFMNITDKIYENLNLQTFPSSSEQQQFAPTISSSATTATTAIGTSTASTSSGVSSSNSGQFDSGFVVGGDEPELYGLLLFFSN